MSVETQYVQGKYSKLTVTGEGDVRIKIPQSFTEDERQEYLCILTNIAEQVLIVNHGKTMRGKFSDKNRTHITMYNDSKKEHFGYSVK